MSSNYISHFFHKHGGTILTFLSSVGVIGTAYLSGKASIKADKKLKELGKEPDLKQKAKVLAPIYAPTAAVGAATILCMFGANSLSRKQQASMLAAGALMEQTYKKYRDKAEEFLGDNFVEKEAAKNIPDEVEPEDGKKLYYYNYLEDGEIPEHRYNGYFNAIPEQVWDAKYELNRTFRFRCAHSKNGYVTLNEFFKLLGREPIECGDNLGWSEDLATEYYGYIWIDIKIDEVTLEDGMVVNVITTPFPPTILA